jgi:hypothetical protein
MSNTFNTAFLPHVALLSVMCFSATVDHGHAGTLRTAGGNLTVNGTVTASNVVVESGATLRGAGAIVGDVLVSGTVSLGVAPASTIGTQTVYGAVSFSTGSVFECHATGHTLLDRVNATGTVGGTCTVLVTTEASAIPVEQIIVSGGSASDFSGFTSSNSGRWRLGETGTVDLIVTDLIGDSDMDSMPDFWELSHFSDRTNASATAHADADTCDNLSEYIADTDPNDAASFLSITNLTVTGAMVSVFWQGGREVTQHLETVVSLSPTATVWQVVHTNTPPTTVTASHAHGPVTNDHCFYRIRVVR